MGEDHKAKVEELFHFLAGRGLPTVAASDYAVELEVMNRIRTLVETKPVEEARDLLNGDWRLVFTTSDQLATLSSIMGGPLKVYYESINNGSIHIASPFKGAFLLLIAPVILIFSLVFSVLGKFTFLGSFLLTASLFALAAKYGPTGLFASRRVGLTIDENMNLTSRLDRDVVALLASQCGFDKSSFNPMATFTNRFDEANGAKDILKVGLFMGWRLVPKPLCLHLIVRETVRKERVLYVDKNVRIMMGGDLLKDGGCSSSLSIFVRI